LVEEEATTRTTTTKTTTERLPDAAESMKALVRAPHRGGLQPPGDWTVCETTLADDYTARYGAEGKAKSGATTT
jgi:hypothetical protein